jgi:hypothetical protein
MANSALNKLKSKVKSKTLVGKQKNLDVNKNGKLDKEDFKILRGNKMAKGGDLTSAQIKAKSYRVDSPSETREKKKLSKALIKDEIKKIPKNEMKTIQAYMDNEDLLYNNKMSKGGLTDDQKEKLEYLKGQLEIAKASFMKALNNGDKLRIKSAKRNYEDYAKDYNNLKYNYPLLKKILRDNGFETPKYGHSSIRGTRPPLNNHYEIPDKVSSPSDVRLYIKNISTVTTDKLIADLKENGYEYKSNKDFTGNGYYSINVKYMVDEDKMAKGGELKSKFKDGDMVYSYQNKDYAAPINYVRFSPWNSDLGSHPNDTFKYRLTLKDGNSNWINEESLYKTKQNQYAKGGEVDDFYDNLQVHVQGVGTIYHGQSMKEAIKKAEAHLLKNPKAEVVIVDEKYGDEYDLNGNQVEDDYAKGGELSEAKMIQKLSKQFEGKDLWDDEIMDEYEVKMFDYREDEEMEKWKRKNREKNYVVPFDSEDDSYVFILVPKDKMEKGGYMADGGYIYKVGDIIHFKDGEDWKVMKVKNLINKLVIKPYNEKAKEKNVSIEIDIDMDYVEKNANKMANGGSIPNNYKGKKPEQVWNEWTYRQKEHFLDDHIHQIKKESGDAGWQKARVINKSYEDLPLFVSDRIIEHITTGQYAEGGEIKNQYKGKKAEQVWNEWSIKQKEHFLDDHEHQLRKAGADTLTLLRSSKKSYDDLPLYVSNALIEHVTTGQYAEGGETGKYNREKLLKEVEEYDDILITNKDGEEFIVYSPSDYNDENTALWKSNDYIIGTIPNDGREVKVKYSDIVKVSHEQHDEYAKGGETKKDIAVDKNGKAYSIGDIIFVRANYYQVMFDATGKIVLAKLDSHYFPYGKNIEAGTPEFIYILKNGTIFSNRQNQMAKGGYMEDGGSLAEQNNDMLQSTITEMKHHVDELKSVVSKNTEVEPWVIAKAERASTDLSDITHYLEGEKQKGLEMPFEKGGYMAEGGMMSGNSVVKEKIDSVLSSNTNEELNRFINPVKFMLEQAFAEDVDIEMIEYEATKEMEFQLEMSEMSNNKNNYKELRLIFAKIKAIFNNASAGFMAKGGYMAAGGMTPGRYYKDNSGNELRYVGESKGKLLFKDGEKIVEKEESDFEDSPKEDKFFGFFKEGGEIKNQYENLTPKEIWSMWTEKQRMHFIRDHKHEFPEIMDSTFILAKKDFGKLPARIQIAVEFHTEDGEYAMGGRLSSSAIERMEGLVPVGMMREFQKTGMVLRKYLKQDGFGDKDITKYLCSKITNEYSEGGEVDSEKYEAVQTINQLKSAIATNPNIETDTKVFIDGRLSNIMRLIDKAYAGLEEHETITKLYFYIDSATENIDEIQKELVSNKSQTSIESDYIAKKLEDLYDLVSNMGFNIEMENED